MFLTNSTGMKKTPFGILFILVLFSFGAMGQQVMEFSLDQAIDYAMENNYAIRNSRTDIDISRRQVSSVTAIGLPQINATVDYSNFLELPTSLIPGEFFGEEPGTFIPIQFGTEHNITAEASLSQLIFSGSYIIGLQAARSVVEVSKIQLEKEQHDLRETISISYSNALVVNESFEIIDSLLYTLRKMLFEVEETYKSGFIEETDVDQISLLVSDLEATRLQVSQQVEVVMNYLKYYLGLPFNQEIRLTDELEDLLTDVDDAGLMTERFDYTRHVDYRLVQGQETLKTFNLKNKKAQNLPTLMGFLSVTENAQRNSFNFLKADEDWYFTSMFGINLSIPILSSGQRHHEIEKARLELQQLQVMNQQVREGLQLQYVTVLADYRSSMEVYLNKKNNVEIADKIYRKTILKYTEGVATSMDLLQSYNQLLDAESTYLTSIMDLLTAKTKLEKVLSKE